MTEIVLVCFILGLSCLCIICVHNCSCKRINWESLDNILGTHLSRALRYLAIMDIRVCTGPGDYTPTSGTFVFSASTPTTQCFDVPTSPDNINEDRECFNVRISTPSTLGLSLNPDTTTACIIEAGKPL